MVYLYDTLLNQGIKIIWGDNLGHIGKVLKNSLLPQNSNGKIIVEGGDTVIHTAMAAMSIAKTCTRTRPIFKTMHIRVFDVSTTVVEAA